MYRDRLMPVALRKYGVVPVLRRVSWFRFAPGTLRYLMQGINDMSFSPLLRNEGPTAAVRVCAGWAIQARDDHAPNVSRVWFEGEEIPNFSAKEAEELIALGAVERV